MTYRILRFPSLVSSLGILPVSLLPFSLLHGHYVTHQAKPEPKFTFKDVKELN